MARVAVKILKPGYFPGANVGEVRIVDVSTNYLKTLQEYGAVEQSSYVPLRGVQLTASALADATVEQVRANIDNGTWDDATVQILERAGRQRAGILGDEPAGNEDSQAEADDKPKAPRRRRAS